MIQKKLLLPFTTTVTLTYLKYKSENLKQCYQLIHCKQLLLASDHILDIDFAFCHLGFADDSHIRDFFRIGITHLLLHLGRLRI